VPTTTTGHPGRILIVLGVLVAGLITLMAVSQTWTPKLGLDLQGGTTITLTAQSPDGGPVDPTSLELAQTIIQNRVDSLGVGESEVVTAGDRQLIVTVPNVQQDELVQLVGQTALLRFRAVYAAEQVQPPPAPEPTATGSPSPSEEPTTEASGDATPSASTTIAPQPTPTSNNRPFPALPTAPPPPPDKACQSADGQGTPQDQAMEWEPTEACQAAFAEFTCDQKPNDVPDQALFACDQTKTEKYLLGPALIEGDQLANATAGIPQNGIAWQVNLEFNAEGAELFETATTALSAKEPPQNQFAIVLDGIVISAPRVENPIPGGRAEITGNFTQESANQLANTLKYGALPLSFEVSEVNNVSATLGGEQLRAGIIAGIIGLILVVGFCFLYYRGLGIVVVASLAIAAVITYACMVLLGSSVGFALNLPGIAGAIVAIGVTADSFVILFERIRDEVRDGRSLRTAVETGWRRARQTILIADAVSMLSAIVLFILAIGAVKGFAFTLGLTTLIDVLVVFMFTKPLMTLLARTKFFGGGHRLSGLDPAHLGVAALPGSRTRRPSVAVAAAAAKDGG
jgi:preprotein translocase subunit SecD